MNGRKQEPDNKSLINNTKIKTSELLKIYAVRRVFCFCNLFYFRFIIYTTKLHTHTYIKHNHGTCPEKGRQIH